MTWNIISVNNLWSNHNAYIMGCTLNILALLKVASFRTLRALFRTAPTCLSALLEIAETCPAILSWMQMTSKFFEMYICEAECENKCGHNFILSIATSNVSMNLLSNSSWSAMSWFSTILHLVFAYCKSFMDSLPRNKLQQQPGQMKSSSLSVLKLFSPEIIL